MLFSETIAKLTSSAYFVFLGEGGRGVGGEANTGSKKASLKLPLRYCFQRKGGTAREVDAL